MKIKHLLSCVAISLLSIGSAIGQDVSAILNALQERNDKVEELRLRKFNTAKAQYIAVLKWSSYATPGQGTEEKWKTDFEDIFFETHIDFGGEEPDEQMRRLEEEYYWLFGDSNPMQEVFGEYMIFQYPQAAIFYNQFRAEFDAAGAPQHPTDEDIANDSYAVSRWNYQIVRWFAENVDTVTYTKKKIDWHSLGEGSVTEGDVNPLDLENYVSLLSQASIELDRLKRHFFDVSVSHIDQGKLPRLKKFDDISMPKLGRIASSAGLPALAYNVSRLKVLSYYTKHQGGRWYVENPEEQFAQDISELQLVTRCPENMDWSQCLGFDGFMNNLLNINTRIGVYDRVYMTMPPMDSTGFSLVYDTFQFFDTDLNNPNPDISELEYGEGFAAGPPIHVNWNVEQNEEVVVVARVKSENYMQLYNDVNGPGYRKYVGWEEVDFRNSDTVDYRNGRFVSGMLDVNVDGQVFDYMLMHSEIVPLWKPVFDDVELGKWEDVVLKSPVSAGEWAANTSGATRFLLNLGAGEGDIRSAGALVIRSEHGDRGSDLAFHDAIEFIGGKDDFEIVYDYTPQDYPFELSSLAGVDTGWVGLNFTKRWNTPRLQKIVGKDLAVEFAYPNVLHTELKLYWVKDGQQQGTPFNTITIKNLDTTASLPALASHRRWELSESDGLNRTCALEYRIDDTEIDQWKNVCSSPRQTNSLEVESVFDVATNELTTTVKEGGFEEITVVTLHPLSPGPRDVLYPIVKSEVNKDGAVGLAQDELEVVYTYHRWPEELPQDAGGNDIPPTDSLFHYSTYTVTSRSASGSSNIGNGVIQNKSKLDRYGRLIKSNPFGSSQTVGSHNGDTSTVQNQYDEVTTTTVSAVRQGLFVNSNTLSAPHCEARTSTVTLYSENDPAAGKLKWAVHKVAGFNGALTTYSYARQNSGAVVITMRSGVSSSGSDEVDSGTQTVTATNQYGYVVVTLTTDIRSGAVLSSWTAGSERTPWGQPISGTDLSGLTSSAVIDPKTRLVSESTDALGSTTVYEHQSLYGAVTKSTRQGVEVTRNINNPLVSHIEVTGADLSKRKATRTMDNLGRVLSEDQFIDGVANATATYTKGTDNIGSGKFTQFGMSLENRVNSSGEFESAIGNVVPVANDKSYSFVGGYYVTESNRGSSENAFVSTTRLDAYGRVREVITPAPDGVQIDHVVTYTYHFDGNGSSRVIVTTSGGRNSILESDPHVNNEENARVSLSRSGIDMNGDGELTKEIDTFSLSTTSIVKAAGADHAVVKSRTQSLAGNFVESEFDTATHATSVNYNGEEKVTHSVNYTTKKSVTCTMRSTSESGDTFEETSREELDMDHNWLCSKVTVSGHKVPSLVTNVTRRSDGSSSNVSTSIGGVANYSCGWDELGFTIGNVVSPYVTTQVVENGYDEMGNRIVCVNDGTGEVETVVSPDGLSVSVHGSNVIDQIATGSFDQNGYNSSISATEGNTAVTSNKVSAAGVATEKSYPDASKSSVKYNHDRTIESVTDARGKKTSMTYTTDPRKLLEGVHFPTLHSELGDGGSIIYGYRLSDSKVTSVTDKSGASSLDYGNNRLESLSYLSGPFSGVVIDPSFDYSGRYAGCRVAVPKQGGGTREILNTTVNYNGISSQIESIENSAKDLGASDLTTTFGYSAELQLLTSCDRGGLVQTNAREAKGRLTGISYSKSGVPSFGFNEYDQISRRKKVSEDGAEWVYNYDDNGFLTSAVNPTLGSFHYNMDASGRRVGYGAVQDEFSVSNNILNQVTGYGQRRYFDLNIFSHAGARIWVNGQEIVNQGGAFLHRVDASGIGTSQNYAPYSVLGVLQNQGQAGAGQDARAMVEGFAFVPPSQEVITYDEEGNRESSSQFDYKYDARNNLVQVTSKNFDLGADAEGVRVTFKYNASGQRFYKSVEKRTYRSPGAWVTSRTETWFLYDGWSLVYERRENGIDNQLDWNTSPLLERHYVWGLDSDGTMGGLGGAGGLLSYTEVSSVGTATYLPTYDGRGNVTSLVRKGDNEIVAKYAYGPYGEQISAEGVKAASNPWRFATKYLDEETGFYYFGFRYYDTKTGNWLSREPLGESESINLYAYCNNDPINKVDVLGLKEVHIFEWNHLLPQEFKDHWDRVGIKYNNVEFGVLLKVKDHKHFHGKRSFGKYDKTLGQVTDYNKQWDHFFNRFEKAGIQPTRLDVMNHLKELVNRDEYKELLERGTFPRESFDDYHKVRKRRERLYPKQNKNMEEDLKVLKSLNQDMESPDRRRWNHRFDVGVLNFEADEQITRMKSLKAPSSMPLLLRHEKQRSMAMMAKQQWRVKPVLDKKTGKWYRHINGKKILVVGTAATILNYSLNANKNADKIVGLLHEYVMSARNTDWATKTMIEHQLKHEMGGGVQGNSLWNNLDKGWRTLKGME